VPPLTANRASGEAARPEDADLMDVDILIDTEARGATVVDADHSRGGECECAAKTRNGESNASLSVCERAQVREMEGPAYRNRYVSVRA
jgi:hypothetical protein